jgi:hypothetical protein
MSQDFLRAAVSAFMPDMELDRQKILEVKVFFLSTVKAYIGAAILPSF